MLQFFQEEGSRIECQSIVPFLGSDRKALRVPPWPICQALGLQRPYRSNSDGLFPVQGNQTWPGRSLIQYTAANHLRSFHCNSDQKAFCLFLEIPQFPIRTFPLDNILLVLYHCGECLWVEREELLPQAFILCTILKISAIVKTLKRLVGQTNVLHNAGWHHFSVFKQAVFKHLEMKAVQRWQISCRCN